MKKSLKFLSIALLVAAMLLTFRGPPVSLVASTGIPAYDHIFFVIDENHSRAQVIGPAPYLTGLANANAQSSTFYAVTHPSVNNYMALFSGQTYSAITDSCTPTVTTCSTNTVNLADEVRASGRTARGYMETMPSACYLPHDSGAYTERHNPFPYYNQIRTTARCATEDVPYSQLASDLASTSTTPNYAWITPNLQNDMHDGSVATGDTWARNNFPAIFNSPAWKTQHSLLVFTTDEDNFTSVNNIPFIAVSSDGTTKGPGYVSTVHGTFYNWLRTIESAWSLPTMTANDAAATPMGDLFAVGPAPSPSQSASASPSPGSSPQPSPTALPMPTPSPGASPSPAPSPAPSPSAVPTPSPSPTTPPLGSLRAAFYYPWFPESWNQQGLNPFTHYTPWLGYYDSSALAVERSHIAALQYAKVDAGIVSWWGQGSATDSRVPALLAAAKGTSFKWALYYEPALSPTAVASDLAYINSRYAADPSYLHVNGKPVVFVYSRAVASCADAATWVNNNQGDYLNLQVFGGYTACATQPDSWHQYGPASRTDAQGRYSYSVSPGYWKANEPTPKLSRDPVAFATAVRNMVASGATWQLVTTFNEWGEGTQVEPSTQSYDPCSGWSVELRILHNSGQAVVC